MKISHLCVSFCLPLTLGSQLLSEEEWPFEISELLRKGIVFNISCSFKHSTPKIPPLIELPGATDTKRISCWVSFDWFCALFQPRALTFLGHALPLSYTPTQAFLVCVWKQDTRSSCDKTGCGANLGKLSIWKGSYNLAMLSARSPEPWGDGQASGVEWVFSCQTSRPASPATH